MAFPRNYYLLIIGLSIYLCIFISTTVSAKAVIYSFEEQVKGADIILIGMVEEVNNRLFQRDVAVISPNKLIKGSTANSSIKIKFGNIILMPKEDTTKFIIGARYVLFLTKEEENFVLVGLGQGYYHIKEGEYIWFKKTNIKLEEFIEKIEAILQGERTGTTQNK